MWIIFTPSKLNSFIWNISFNLLIAGMQVTTLKKKIRVPLNFVFNWCTDYQETDPNLISSSRKRVILDKTKRRVVYAALYRDDDSNLHVSVYDVKLRPPDSWHFDIFDPDRKGTGNYKLSRLPGNSTALKIVFKTKWKGKARVQSRKEHAKRLNSIWDKYILALEREYSILSRNK